MATSRLPAGCALEGSSLKRASRNKLNRSPTISHYQFVLTSTILLFKKPSCPSVDSYSVPNSNGRTYSVESHSATNRPPLAPSSFIPPDHTSTMADNDWDNVTRIGKSVRAGGGSAVDRERVVKGKSAINAASRSGAIIGTEKKYSSSNTVSHIPRIFRLSCWIKSPNLNCDSTEIRRGRPASDESRPVR